MVLQAGAHALEWPNKCTRGARSVAGQQLTRAWYGMPSLCHKAPALGKVYASVCHNSGLYSLNVFQLL